ncbi:MAG TPA: lytic transglycosylase domain-containing protein [Dyella sp.]|uniref:lytic transglycosylase domain-containing protein n=1 Tax=Dyella sp. TaxID=1869338 RepID=UPI002C5F6985|nr:lytic transglycosylase domain-containing protein [Dyella sp.]HUB90280.1 lytic transglycosylase domain-containing protein [Dyella sp.]
MLPGLELMTCPNLAVSPDVMRHLVNIESSHNPYAIGVVDGQLQRQPENLAEAVATAHMLEAAGYNYSLGVAQINRANLAKYGLDTYEKAFDACLNLSAGSHILAECYASANQDWGKAFSCYYSGNFVTGFRDGYVQKVYESMGRSLQRVQPNAIPVTKTDEPAAINQPIVLKDGPAYRIALRSVALDTAAGTLSATPPQASSSTDALVATPAAAQPATSDVFVPVVHGSGDLATQTSANTHSVSVNNTTSSPIAKSGDSSDPQQMVKDDAFVF